MNASTNSNVVAIGKPKPAHVSAIEQFDGISDVILCGVWADADPARMRDLIHGFYILSASKPTAVVRELLLLCDICRIKQTMGTEE